MYDIKLHYNWDAMVSMTLHKSYTGSNEGIFGSMKTPRVGCSRCQKSVCLSEHNKPAQCLTNRGGCWACIEPACYPLVYNLLLCRGSRAYRSTGSCILRERVLVRRTPHSADLLLCYSSSQGNRQHHTTKHITSITSPNYSFLSTKKITTRVVW